MADPTRLQHLLDQINADAVAMQTKLKRRNVILSCLIVFVIGYMSWIYVKIGALDAQALTEIAVARVRSDLPEMRAKFSNTLIEKMPQMIDEGEQRLLDGIPEIGNRVEELLVTGTEEHPSKLDETLAKLEVELGNELALDLEERMRAMEDADIGKDPESRLNSVLTFVTEDYRNRVDALVDRLYADYSEQMGGLNEMLVRIQSAKDLTPREKAQKDIIECSLALREHYIEPTYPSVLGAESGR